MGPFLLCLCALTVRAYWRIVRAELWAEDGTIFLQEALQHGWYSLTFAHLGSYHTLQRIIAVVLYEIFPLAWLPLLIRIVTIALAAYVFSLFSRKSYRWILPSDRLRVLTCLLLCFIPGLHEKLGNLSNINWLLYWSAALIAVKDPAEEISRWELVALTVVACSTGSFPLLIPLFIWRCWLQRRAPWSAAGAPVQIFLVFLAALVLLPRDRFAPDLIPLLQMAKSYLDHLLACSARPWLGGRLTSFLSSTSLPFWYASTGIFFLGILAGTYRERHSRGVQTLFVLLACTSFWVVLCWGARPGAFAAFQLPISKEFWGNRYAFPVSACGLILWMTLMGRIEYSRRFRMGLCGFFAVLQIGLSFHWIFPNDQPPGMWSHFSPVLERSLKTGCPQSVRIPIQPPVWCLSYYATEPNEKCDDKIEVPPCTIPRLATLTREELIADWHDKVYKVPTVREWAKHY